MGTVIGSGWASLGVGGEGSPASTSVFAGAVTGEPRPPEELEGGLLPPDPGLAEVGRLGGLDAELE